MTDSRRWGRAGERLTGAEAGRRAMVRDLASQREKAERAHRLEVARRKWAEGLVVPAHITVALDALGLHGPEVDEACGAREPEVDLWEAGKLYPRWEQLVKLAALTGKTPDYFMAPITVLSPWETSMRFHLRRGEPLPMPVHRFTARALAAAAAMGVRP